MSRSRDLQRQMTEAEEATFKADLAFVMGDPRGRRLMWWVLELGHPFHTSFSTSAAMPFMEGERNVALKILAQLRLHNHAQYLEMEREAMARQAQAAALAEQARTQDRDDEH